ERGPALPCGRADRVVEGVLGRRALSHLDFARPRVEPARARGKLPAILPDPVGADGDAGAVLVRLRDPAFPDPVDLGGDLLHRDGDRVRALRLVAAAPRALRALRAPVLAPLQQARALRTRRALAGA